MWVLKAHRSRGPAVVGYETKRTINMALTVFSSSWRKDRSELEGEVITLFEDGTWRRGLHG
jgi:hypothetical protein